MNIKEAVDYLNFWIRKERGAFYTIEESVNIIDIAQNAYFNDIMPKYATSQIVKDTLQPFKETVAFSPTTTTNGRITVNDINYYDLLDCTIQYIQNGRDTFYSIKMTNEDELADKLNSQINPPIPTAPVGQMFTTRDANQNVLYQIQLYPRQDIYDGFINYMRRPIKPIYGYTIVGGRNIVYNPTLYNPVTNPGGSRQLEWRNNDITMILLKALSSLGINLSDQEVSQFAELKNQQNYQGVNHL
jgi:hypothetical protein